MIYKIEFVGSQNFTDGNIFPDTKKQGEIIEVDEVTMTKIINSGGQIEVLERRVPPSSVAKPPKEPIPALEGAKTTATKRQRNAKGHFIKAKE